MVWHRLCKKIRRTKSFEPCSKTVARLSFYLCIKYALQAFGRTRGMTSAQVSLAWLLQKAPWMVPIPGTTKLSHFEENLRSQQFTCTSEEWQELERVVAAIPVVGDRYNAEQRKQVGF